MLKFKNEISRTILKPFGINYLDELDLFINFSDDYVIVNKDTIIMK